MMIKKVRILLLVIYVLSPVLIYSQNGLNPKIIKNIDHLNMDDIIEVCIGQNSIGLLKNDLFEIYSGSSGNKLISKSPGKDEYYYRLKISVRNEYLLQIIRNEFQRVEVYTSKGILKFSSNFGPNCPVEFSPGGEYIYTYAGSVLHRAKFSIFNVDNQEKVTLPFPIDYEYFTSNFIDKDKIAIAFHRTTRIDSVFEGNKKIKAMSERINDRIQKIKKSRGKIKTKILPSLLYVYNLKNDSSVVKELVNPQALPFWFPNREEKLIFLFEHSIYILGYVGQFDSFSSPFPNYFLEFDLESSIITEKSFNVLENKYGGIQSAIKLENSILLFVVGKNNSHLSSWNFKDRNLNEIFRFSGNYNGNLEEAFFNENDNSIYVKMNGVKKIPHEVLKIDTKQKKTINVYEQSMFISSYDNNKILMNKKSKEIKYLKRE